MQSRELFLIFSIKVISPFTRVKKNALRFVYIENVKEGFTNTMFSVFYWSPGRCNAIIIHAVEEARGLIEKINIGTLLQLNFIHP